MCFEMFYLFLRILKIAVNLLSKHGNIKTYVTLNSYQQKYQKNFNVYSNFPNFLILNIFKYLKNWAILNVLLSNHLQFLKNRTEILFSIDFRISAYLFETWLLALFLVNRNSEKGKAQDYVISKGKCRLQMSLSEDLCEIRSQKEV